MENGVTVKIATENGVVSVHAKILIKEFNDD